MIEIKPTTDKQVIHQVMTDPILYSMSGEIKKVEDFVIDPAFFYLEFLIDGNIAGLLKVRYITAITVEAHIMLLPEYHGTQISIDIAEKVVEFLKENTELRTIVTFIPSSCFYVIKYMRKIHFELYGIISDGIIYKDRLNDLYCYKYSIKRS